MGDGAASVAQAAMPQGALDITAFIWLLLIASVVAMLGQRIKVPYAVALVVTGLIIGAPRLLPQAHLDPHTLFTVFLPPLLFESSINVHIDRLRRNWQPVAMYALAGTLLSTLIVGGLAAWALGLPLPVALVFGALISPTDPISVIAVFKQLGVGKRLSLLVEAESLFNDGVAVVLFGLLLEAASGGSISLARSIQQFLFVVAGGVGVGLSLGMIASRLTRHFDDHLLEIMLTTIVAFGAYLCAEAVHVSGVIAVVVAGLVVGNYGMRTSMSPATRLAVSSFWEYAAFVVNSIVFLLLGIQVTVVNLWSKIGLVLPAIGIVLVSRAVAIYGLSPLVNRLHASVPFAWQHILFWGSLRGALSMALVMSLRADFPHRETLLVLTFGVVLFSLLAQGLTIGTLLKRLRLAETRTRESEHPRLAGEVLACQAGLRELERLQAKGGVPRPLYESLAQEYNERLGELEKRIETLHLSDTALKEQQTAEARRLILLAEKSELREAERNGLLDEEDARQLVEKINAQLAALHGEHTDH